MHGQCLHHNNLAPLLLLYYRIILPLYTTHIHHLAIHHFAFPLISVHDDLRRVDNLRRPDLIFDQRCQNEEQRDY